MHEFNYDEFIKNRNKKLKTLYGESLSSLSNWEINVFLMYQEEYPFATREDWIKIAKIYRDEMIKAYGKKDELLKKQGE